MGLTGSVDLVGRLRASGCVFAEDEAAVLNAESRDANHLEQMLQRRIAGEPLEQIVGWAEFAGLRLVVTPGVFVPRQRTLLLVQETIAVTPPQGRVLDLCCGVGAVAAAVLAQRPDVRIYLSDIDPFAVDCARRNVPAATAHVGDLFAPLPHEMQFDVIALNAPYVPTDQIAQMPPEARDHEQRAALDGGSDGVQVHRRIAVDLDPWLAPGGHVLIETANHLAPHTAAALEDAGLTTSTVHDHERGGTVVVAHRGSNSGGRSGDFA